MADKAELFEKLKQQINWQPEEYNYFQNATIEKVDVHVESRVWDFHIQVQDILPFKEFFKFYSQLTVAFKDIVKVKLFISTTSPVLTNKNLSE